MDDKNIIIILLAIIAILCVAIGAVLLQQCTPESTIIKITSDKSQYEAVRCQSPSMMAVRCQLN